MAADNENPTSSPEQKKQNGLDERQIRQESGKAAQKAQEAKRRAYELRQAAHGAADAEERQKLLEQAIDKEIEAESFGKTARYMRSGTFQGMAVGTGIGVVPGVTLGTLTGTLVGGVTSAITGGLGAGVGALTGALHGPFWNMGKVLGKGVRKVTGDLPGWAATDSQKKTLEKMMGQIQEEDMPDDEELEKLKQDGEADEWWNSWYQSGVSYLPSMPSWMKSKEQEPKAPSNADQRQGAAKMQPKKNQNNKQPGTFQPPKQGAGSPFYRNTNPATQKAGHDVARRLKEREANKPQSQENDRPAPEQNTLDQKSEEETKQDNETSQQGQPRGKPRKLEVRSANAAMPSTKSSDKRPRKIERRS